MSKNDRYRPPMSLEESERLLRAEADHRKVKGEWAMVGNFLLLIGSAAGLLACAGLILYGIFG